MRVIAPASPVEEAALRNGCAEIERLGFVPKWDPRVLARQGYFAGSAEERSAKFQAAFDDDGSAAIICSDGTFTVAPPMMTEPYELGETLTVGRSFLEPKHGPAYREYDRLVKKDKDALKQARLEKIIGAIENNLKQIPELKERLKALVREWP